MFVFSSCICLFAVNSGIVLRSLHPDGSCSEGGRTWQTRVQRNRIAFVANHKFRAASFEMSGRDLSILISLVSGAEEAGVIASGSDQDLFWVMRLETTEKRYLYIDKRT